MATSPSASPAATAPWDVRRNSSGKHRLRRLLPWLAALLLLALVGWGFWPKPVLVETATVSRAPLTVRVSEEGKTRIRNRYVVAAAVAGRMRRVPLKPGDEVLTVACGFPTTVNPIIQNRLVPVFVDVGLGDYGPLPERMRK